MPVYEFRCTSCDSTVERLLPLGDNGPRPCEACGGELRQQLSRVAVKYASWGFTATDGLVGDTRGKDFKALRSKAEQLSDE